MMADSLPRDVRSFVALVCVLTAFAYIRPAGAVTRSTVDRVTIVRVEDIGMFGSITFQRSTGTIEGRVAATEPVAGLEAFAGANAAVPYKANFVLIAPVNAHLADGVIVGANNRGNPITSLLFAPMDGRPMEGSLVGQSEAFLLSHGLAVASIQWQSEHTINIPVTAQGMGEVVMRDFGRMLGGAFASARGATPIFRHRILTGISQSAWFVNAFIAEGFNADPTDGHAVFQGAFTRNGAGNVMAINRYAKGGPQTAYVMPRSAPLLPRQLLARPESDPFVVDVASFTDFYRLHAGLFYRAPRSPRLRRYATIAPHAPGIPATVGMVRQLRCNGGIAVPLNQITDALYLRPLLLGLMNRIGIATAGRLALPTEAKPHLVPAQGEYASYNRLGNELLWVPGTTTGPRTDVLPMLAARFLLGVMEPVALTPVGVSSATDICGNFAGWQPFQAAQLRHLYRSRASLLRQVQKASENLVRDGRLLQEDQTSAITSIEAQLPADFL